MDAILSILAWLVVIMALVVIVLSARYLVLHPRGTKRYLRVYNIISAGYICLLYILLAARVFHIGVFPAVMARVGFIILLGLFAAEIIANGHNGLSHPADRADLSR